MNYLSKKFSKLFKSRETIQFKSNSNEYLNSELSFGPNVESNLPLRTVLVLDVSESMSENGKLKTLQLSATRHLADIPLESYVGIVWFSHWARTEHEVVKISDQSVRRSLTNKLPKQADGSTDIGAGILEGLAALKRSGLSTEGASILLATDGRHNRYDPIYGYNYMAKVLPELLSSKVRVFSLAIGSKADNNLESLSKSTDGTVGMSYDTIVSKSLRSSNSVMKASVEDSSHSKLNPMFETISVCNELIELKNGLNEMQVIIDADIGNNTIFKIESEHFDRFSVTLLGPNAKTFQLTVNRQLKWYKTDPMFAKSGVWAIRLLSDSKKTISANVLVSSRPTNAIPIRMEVLIKELTTNSPPIIVAKLLKGLIGVNGAEVTATVERPDGTESQLKLKNFENIYCNYFTDYCGFGRYNVSVSAKSVANVTNLIGMYDTFDGLISPERVQPFQRQQMIGCFKIDEFMPSKPSNDQKLQELASSLFG